MLFVLVNCLHSKIELSVCWLTLSKPLNWRLNTLWLSFEISELLQWSRSSEHYWEQWLAASDGVAVHVCSVPGLYSCSWYLAGSGLLSRNLWLLSLLANLNCMGARESLPFLATVCKGKSPFDGLVTHVLWVLGLFFCCFFFPTESHREILFSVHIW